MKISFLKIVFVLTLSVFCLSPFVVSASSTNNMSGYAWSSNIGWISFNCTNTEASDCTTYGVNKDTSGNLTGYAWSPTIGWINFSGVSVVNNNLTGWAQVLSADGNGWDGKISLSGSSPSYGVTLNGTAFSGYAWGSEVVGWIDFSRVIIGALVSGTITPATSTCTIASGDSTCSKTLTWSTSNPTVTSEIKGPSGQILATGNSGSKTFTVSYNNGLATNFSLYNGDNLLAVAQVTPSCATGNSWNNTTLKCVPGMSGTLTPVASPSCIIGEGLSTCGVNLYWSIVGPEGIPTAITASGMTNKTVTNTLATPQSGTASSLVVTYPSRTFYLYNNAKTLATLTITSSCTTGTSWDGTKCAPGARNTLTPATSTCYITAGNSTCAQTLNWSTASPIAGHPSIVRIFSNKVTPNTATGDTSSQAFTFPYTNGANMLVILYNGNYIEYGYDNVELARANVATTCVSGTSWDGTKCSSSMSGTLTPATSTCTITSGNSTCVSNLNWSIVSPEGTPTAITASGMTNVNVTNTLTTPQSGTASSLVVPYPSRIFYLYNNAKTLATSTVTASCASGTSWDGTKCAPGMTGTLTPATSTCTITSGNSTCVSNLNWSINNPEGTPTAITASGMTDKIVTNTLNTPQSGSASFTVPYSSRTFYLYNNAKTLATSIVTASCDVGTAWNGAVCITTLVPVNGVCSSPLAHYDCSSGTSANPIEDASVYTWDCLGSNGGTSTSCTENKSFPLGVGACSSPADRINPCISGMPSTIINSPTKWTWTCNGSGGSASCSQKKSPGYIER